eukprot:jgi/Hompol1/1955/HPOL_005796-RA
MGMDLYKSSAVARSYWDRADKYMIESYGVSLLEIVRDNPKSKTVFFGGPKGAKIREHYMSMMYDTIDENGNPKSVSIFPTITESTTSYTFQHPQGLLSATQFTQPALTTVAICAFSDMKQNGLVRDDSAFAGHSLGEYAALCSMAEVLTIEGIMDITFYRGMTMQVAVPRDSQGRSQYGMAAVNPVRVSTTLGEPGLKFIIASITRCSNNGLIEIVNFNIENWQYVVAGELVYLDTLRLVLDRIKALNLNFIELTKTKTIPEIEALLDDIVNEKIKEAQAAKEAAGGFPVAKRGVATIPLAGIDVPFHSSFLNNGITPFRNILLRKLVMRYINVERLIGKYIPNLTARPFSIDLSYFEYVHSITKSRLVKTVLDEWKQHDAADPAVLQHRGYILLIELLAHQFASPVRWIETQDLLFKQYKVERLIEVGPSPVLVGMAERTLKMKYEAVDDAVTQIRAQLCTSKNRREIYYEFEDTAAPEPESTPAAAAAAPVAVAAPVVVAAPAPVAAAAAGPVADAPIPAKDVLFVLIAHKLKKPIAEIAPTKTIKDLVGGKSTLQNEILGDLGAEFGNVLAEKSEELPLGEVATALQASHSGSLGKTSGTLVNKLVSGKMPGGFGMGQVKAHLSTVHGLGPKRTDAALLHGLLHEPAARLGSEAEAKAWLDKVASSYAASAGISLGGGSAPAAAAAAPVYAAAPAAGGAGPIADAPIAAKEVLFVLIASKLKKPIGEIAPTKTIKDLVGGKSTLQNEILGDLGAEFGNVLAEKSEELPLGEVATALQASHSGSLGKTSNGLVNKLVSGKMPGGFGMGQVKAHLSAAHGLGPKRSDGLLLHGLLHEPAARLGSEAEAKAWLDKVASSYAASVGISLGGGASPSAGGAPVGLVSMNSKDFIELKEKMNKLVRQQLGLYSKFLDLDLLEGARLHQAQKDASAALQVQLDLWQAEHGDVYAEGIRP